MEESTTIKSQPVKKRFSNGEIHIILPESILEDDVAEIRKETRKEASRPLLLSRME